MQQARFGINGNNLNIINNTGGVISGGAGSDGGGGGKTYRYDAGIVKGGNGGNGGNGGDGIRGDNQKLTNYGTVTGGAGGDGGNGGNGGELIASNDGGAGGDGGNGGDGIVSNHLTFTNDGTISGGNGGNGSIAGKPAPLAEGRGKGGNGGNGGDGVRGDYLILSNRNTVSGGTGGSGRAGLPGGSGGSGGHGIHGSYLVLDNSGIITGGAGGSGGSGGSGSLYFYIDKDRYGGSGGNAGNGIYGSNLSLINSGTVSGGSNRNSYGGASESGIRGGSGGNGGNAGDGIRGSDLSVINNGTVSGGNSENSYGGAGGKESGGNGGNGGDGIRGSNLSVINSGTVIRGTAVNSGGGAGGTDGVNGAAIRATGGENTLTLNDGSNITGDIIMSDAGTDGNSLFVINHAETIVDGNFIVGSGTAVTLTDGNIGFTGSAAFAENTSLGFRNGGTLHATSVSFSSREPELTRLITNITRWNLKDITLVTTDNGISGYYSPESYNPLLTEGARDYAGVNLTDGNKNLVYSLKWFSEHNDAYGTFDLKQGAELDLNLILNDNLTVTALNETGWDGKNLTKAGDGTLILSAKNTYTGSTVVSGGTLQTGTENAIAGTTAVSVDKPGILDLAGHSQQLGTEAVTDNRGILLINSVNSGPLNAPVRMSGNMINRGSVIIGNCDTCTGQTYIQDGNWTGDNGTVYMNTVLGDDSSKTDTLIITGTATGKTTVSVSNQGGSGAQTTDGIRLIETGGSSAGAFEQSGRIVAGSYDYHLQQGNKAGADTDSWYLTSGKNNGGNIPDYRPERGSYAANLAAAGTMFDMRLADRQGSNQYTDPLTGEYHRTSLWGYLSGGHTKSEMSDGQSDSTANRIIFHLGGDVLAGQFAEDDAWHAGVMAGYGRQDSKTRNAQSGYTSRGNVQGYSAGIYGTWYQHADSREGLYADTRIQYSWFDNTVKGDELSEEKYNSRGVSLSAETGYNLKTAEFKTAGGAVNQMNIRPQAQLRWSGIRADEHTESNGTVVQSAGGDNLQTRLGIRVSLTGQGLQSDNGMRQVEPFIEVNWINNSKKYGVRMNGEAADIEGSRNLGEIKAGAEGQITENLSVWANVSHQRGSTGYQDTQGLLGFQYRF